MRQAILVFLAKLSHEWSLPVLGVVIVSIGFAVWASRRARGFARPTPQSRMAVVSQVTAGVVAMTFVASQLHLPCAMLASGSTTCLDNVKSLAQAQLIYADDNDGRALVSDDWIIRAGAKKKRKLSCNDATGKNSYTLNLGVARQSLFEVDDPRRTVLVFESDKWPLGIQSDVATDRHNKTAIVAVADGSATRRPIARISELVWAAPKH